MFRDRNWLALTCPHFADDGDDGGDGGNGDGGSGGGNSGGDGGKQFTPISSQEDFDKAVQDRVRRAEQKGYKSAEEKYKPGHDRAQSLDDELASETEKQVKAAREEERKKASEQTNPRLVRQAFRAEAKGVLTDEQLEALLEDYNPANYLTDDGDVDEAKVANRVKKFAGKPGGNGSGGGQPPRTLGQGNHPPSNAKKGALGLAEAEKRFKHKTSATQQ